jgi:hypothetical protein
MGGFGSGRSGFRQRLHWRPMQAESVTDSQCVIGSSAVCDRLVRVEGRWKGQRGFNL